MKRGPQVFDLPTANLHEYVGHYIPPRARDGEEANRRSKNPAGTVILEAQHDGARILERTYTLLEEDKESRLFLARELGAVCLNTAWYNYANDSSASSAANADNIARRRLSLPKHAWIYDDGEVQYETEEGNDAHTIGEIATAVALAGGLEKAHISQAYSKERRFQRQFGRAIGNLGLRLAAAPLIGQRAEPHIIQTNVRNAGTDAIKRSRDLYDNTYPTLAQLSDPDSQLFVHIRRIATTPIREAIKDATEQVEEEQYYARAA